MNITGIANKRAFLICPVRNLGQEEREEIKDYVDALENVRNSLDKLKE